MKKLCLFAGAMVAAFLIILTAHVARAGPIIMEKYLDLYAGQAEFNDKTVRATYETVSIFGSSSESAERDTSFSSSGVVGGRWGFWFKDYPRFGFAIDLSFMNINGRDVSIKAIPISGLLFYRYPLLVNKDNPHGKIQPYFGLGMSLINGDLSVDFTPDISEKISGVAGGTGIDLRAGIKTFIGRKTGLFIELRHLQGNISINDESDPLLPAGIV